MTNGDETEQIWQSRTIGAKIAPVRLSRPLWLSMTGYFLVSLAASLFLFFIVWGLLYVEDEADTTYIPAGVSASLMLGLAVVAREVVMRRARTRYLLKRDQFGLPVPPKTKSQLQPENKFSIEKNNQALRGIQRKSDEAETSVATAEKHLEVFRACQEYLEMVELELQKVHVGSPRLPALRNGQDTVRIIHKHHLLRWTAEETRRLTREANVLVSLEEKIETSNRAHEVLNFALQFYPNDSQLLDSVSAVREFTTSIRVADWIELAERAAFKGNFKQAIDNYHDALFYLQRETAFNAEERELTTAKLDEEIVRLRSLMNKKKNMRQNLPPKKDFNK